MSAGSGFGYLNCAGDRAFGNGYSDDRLANLNGVALLVKELGHGSGKRARKFNKRLCGLNLDDDLVYLDFIARLNLPRNDLSLGKSFTNVGEEEVR